MTPEYVNVAAVLSGEFKAPQTTVGGRRSDQIPLLYAGAVNVLLGDPEAGKTLVAGGMAADELFMGGRVLWLDLDHNGALSLINRLMGFGVSKKVLSDRESFRLAVPDDANELVAIVADASWVPTLTIVDSLGELLPMFGANSNDADDYTRVHRTVLTKFANTGAAVLAIDHQAKNESSRSFGATGSAAKKRAIDGALFRVTNVRPFAPGAGGEAHLAVLKDRHGFLRALGAGREPVVATFTLDPVAGGNNYRFGVPTAPAAPVADIDVLKSMSPPPTSVKDVRERNGWGTERASTALRIYRDVTSNASNDTVTPGVQYVTPLPPLKGVTGNDPGNESRSVA